MFSSFISVVGLVSPDKLVIKNYLINVHKELKNNFSDFEIVLVNNRTHLDIKELDKDILKSVTALNLSKQIDSNNAIVAGLDRANGDYTVIFDMELRDKPTLITELYKKTQENFDIVYLKYKDRKIPLRKRIFYKVFYFIMKKYSDLEIDKDIHQSRIISRRALNAINKVRENLRYMKGIYSFIGYNTCALEVDIPGNKKLEKFSEQFKLASIAITSFTNILSKLLLWIFILSLLFSISVTTNAMMVKFIGFDIFGNPQKQVPGWTFLVVLMSIMFVLLCLILYIFSVYLASINNEIKQRPVYIIESIQRF